MATLTSADMVQLEKYASSGDRYNYWKFLSNKGDRYATLALSVVTNESLLGQSANAHFAAYYLNKTGKTQTSQEAWATGTKIMQADLAMRKNYLQSPTTKNPLDLTIEDIRNYHKAVFVDQMNLDATAWTFEDIYQDILRDKGKVAAEAFWDDVLDSSTITAAFITLLEYGENLDTPIGKEWAKTQFLVFAKQTKVISNRSVDKLDYNGKTYTYDYKNKKWYYEVGGVKTFIKEEAPGSLQTILNNERNFRIQKFGNNVINSNTSNLFHFMPSEADWNKFLAESVTALDNGNGYQLVGTLNGNNATITIYKDSSSSQKYSDINGNEIEVKLDANNNLTSVRTLEKTTNLTTEITRTYKTIVTTNETIATDINRVRDANNNIVWSNSSIIISSDKGVIELMPHKNAVTGKYELVAASKTLEGESTLLSQAELNNLLTKMGVNPSLLNSSTGDLTALYSAVNSATNTTQVIQAAIDHQEAWELKADYIFNGAQKIFNDIFNVETLNGAVQAWFSENFNNLVNGTKSESELLYSFVKKYFETYAKDKISDSFQSFIANNTTKLSQSEAVIALQKISDKVFGTNASHLTQGVGQVLVSSLSKFIATAVVDGKGYNSSQYATLAASTLVSSAATYTIIANSVPGLTMVNSAGSITLSPAGQGAVAAIVTTAASLIDDHKLNSSEYSMLGVQAAIAAISTYIGAAASVILTPIGGAIVAAAVNFVLSKVVSSIYKGKVYYENEYGTVEEAWASRFLITGEMTKTSDGKDYYKKTMHLVDHFVSGSNSGGTAPSNTLSYTERFNVDDIVGTKSVDVAIGNIKDNIIVTHEGDDFVMAEGGDDQISLGDGVDFVYGGAGNDTILGQLGNDLIFGDSGNDTLVGGEGNDIIDGGAGDDVLLGDRELNSGETTVVGYGNDILFGGKGNDYIDGGEGNDILIGGAGVDQLFGGKGDDILLGDNVINEETDRDNILNGGSGNDYIVGGVSNDNLNGEDGDDIISGSGGNDIISGGNGNDYLETSVWTPPLNLFGTVMEFPNGKGTSSFLEGGDGEDFLVSHNGDDILVGGAGNDIIRAGMGKDIIDAGRGNDIVQIGKGANGTDVDLGLGDDTFIIEEIENVTIRDSSGIDKILLSKNIFENVELIVNGVDLIVRDKLTNKIIKVENQFVGDQFAIDFLEFGNGQFYDLKSMGSNGLNKPTLSSGANNVSSTLNNIQNILSGFEQKRKINHFKLSITGNMDGNLGKRTVSPDDFLEDGNVLVNDININIIKRKRSIFGGYYTVVQAQKIDKLYTSYENVAVLDENGNQQNITVAVNQIIGAEWDEEIYSTAQLGSSTILVGNGGNDKFYLSSGTDFVYGGSGDDLITNNPFGSLIMISSNDYIRGGTGNDNITGGKIDPFLLDNNWDGVIDSKDVLLYNSGGSTSTAADSLYGDEDNDIITGYVDAYMDGGDGNDNFYGGSSYQGLKYEYVNIIKDRRVMKGGAGNDVYWLNEKKDKIDLYPTIFEENNEGIDTINLLEKIDYFDLNFYSNVENLNASSTISLNNNYIGNELNNQIWGSNQNDIIDGRNGIDTVLYSNAKSAVTVNLSNTAAQATGGSGLDTLLNVENLTGSAYNDTLIGNTANNTLNGGVGADRMEGGLGNDTYYVDNASDVVVEAASGGTDLVYATVSHTLAAEVENLSLQGTASINATGNALNNIIYTNAGNNIIDGGAGIDTVTYANATSAITVNLSNTAAQATGGSGSDTLLNVENLTGSKYNDILTGNSGINVLDGGIGNDTLTGDKGNDTYIFARGSNVDTIVENDATAGNKDALSFGSNIAANQLWFTKTGNNLEVSVIGTTDKAVIKDWYLGNAYHVEELKSGNGLTLLDSQVQNLVNAMASLTPPAVGQTSLSADYQTKLNPVITANWK
ncbi:calcium-binding protein [Acinetobacter oleivorans]|uniref:calcium-binding protein n=2 Tax=Acinetobacter TaxID=469 RepID=UPI003A8B16DC